MKRIFSLFAIIVALLLIVVVSNASKVKTNFPYIYCPYCANPYEPGDCKSERDTLGHYSYTYTCHVCGSDKALTKEEQTRIMSLAK